MVVVVTVCDWETVQLVALVQAPEMVVPGVTPAPVTIMLAAKAPLKGTKVPAVSVSVVPTMLPVAETAASPVSSWKEPAAMSKR